MGGDKFEKPKEKLTERQKRHQSLMKKKDEPRHEQSAKAQASKSELEKKKEQLRVLKEKLAQKKEAAAEPPANTNSNPRNQRKAKISALSAVKKGAESTSGQTSPSKFSRSSIGLNSKGGLRNSLALQSGGKKADDSTKSSKISPTSPMTGLTRRQQSLAKSKHLQKTIEASN